MSGAHTPGPWVALIAGKVVEVNDGKGAQRPNAIVHWTGFEATDRPLAERKANARLIALAPEMLKELQRLLEREHNPFEPDNQSATYQRLSTLIAKATGSAA